MNNYISYASALKLIIQSKNNFKSAIFQHFKSNPEKLKAAYGFLIKTCRYFPQFKDIAEQLIKKKKADIQNVYLFSVYCTDLFLSEKKKIQGGGKIKKILMENKEFIEKLLVIQENDSDDENQLQDGEKKNNKVNPENEKSENQKQFQIKSASFLRFFQNENNNLQKFEQKYSQEIQKSENDIKNDSESKQVLFTLDEDVKNLIKIDSDVYRKMSKVKGFFQEKSFVIQSKSSAFPAYVIFDFFEQKMLKNLASIAKKKCEEYQFDIIDSCAAPGNKTLQLADYLQGRGRVFAFEKNPQRFQLLQHRVKEYGFEEKIICFNEDFLKVDILDPKFKNVQLVLMDPSCSGSGMLNHIYFDSKNKVKHAGQKQQQQQKQSQQSQVMEIEEDQECVTQKQFVKKCSRVYEELNQREKERVQQLHDFQLQILQKGISFPNVKLVSYSTCSIYEKENEEVVKDLLNRNDKILKLEHILPNWKTRGFKQQSLMQGDKCVRVNPYLNKETDGFFVALFRVNHQTTK